MGKLNTFFIVEIAKLERGPGKHPIPGSEYLTMNGHKNRWVTTETEKEVAIQLAKSYMKNYAIVMVMVAEWQGEGCLKTRSHSTLQCSPGAMIKHVPFFAERSYAERKYAQGSNGRFHEIKIGPWKESTPGVKDYPLGGGNWLTWNPDPLSENEAVA